jgi:hypothetical protein
MAKRRELVPFGHKNPTKKQKVHTASSAKRYEAVSILAQVLFAMSAFNIPFNSWRALSFRRLLACAMTAGCVAAGCMVAGCIGELEDKAGIVEANVRLRPYPRNPNDPPRFGISSEADAGDDSSNDSDDADDSSDDMNNTPDDDMDDSSDDMNNTPDDDMDDSSDDMGDDADDDMDDDPDDDDADDTDDDADDDMDDDPDDTVPPPPAECGDVPRDILVNDMKCGGVACHGTADAPATAQVDFGSSGDIFERLKDANPDGTSTDDDCKPLKLIDTSSPDDSLMISKLLDEPPCGEHMPYLLMITEEEEECIIAWTRWEIDRHK